MKTKSSPVIAWLALFYACASPAAANVFTYNLDNVTFSDGGTAIESFSFDDTPSGCTGSGSCDYPITNVAILTSPNPPFGFDYGAPPSPFNLLGAYVEYPTQGPSQPYTSIFIQWSVQTAPGSATCPCESLGLFVAGGLSIFPNPLVLLPPGGTYTKTSALLRGSIIWANLITSIGRWSRAVSIFCPSHPLCPNPLPGP